MTLYEIDSAIMDCVDEETGEIIDLEKLEALNIERDKKVEGIALAVKNYAAEAKAIKEEEEKLAKRRRSCENAAQRCKDYLSHTDKESRLLIIWNPKSSGKKIIAVYLLCRCLATKDI